MPKFIGWKIYISGMVPWATRRPKGPPKRGRRGDIYAIFLSANHSFPHCSITKRDLTIYINKEV